jgi:hypothetical protein
MKNEGMKKNEDSVWEGLQTAVKGVIWTLNIASKIPIDLTTTAKSEDAGVKRTRARNRKSQIGTS